MIKLDNLDINKFVKHTDHRGSFYEIPNFTKSQIYQSSISISNKNTIRGLHYQHKPEMGKQINILKGSILECIVDIRIGSDSFGKHIKIFCTPDDNSSVFIPPGFAHGFLSLEDDTKILYYQTAKHNTEGEGTINLFDEQLGIPWPIAMQDCLISERDLKAESIQSYKDRNIEWS